jgi:hypothetical protein
MAVVRGERTVTVPEREYRGMREALSEAQGAVERLARQVENCADLRVAAENALEVLDAVLSAPREVLTIARVGTARDELHAAISGVPNNGKCDLDDLRDRHDSDVDVQALCDEVEKLRAKDCR